MLKKTINYENFDGVPTSEEFYFNITKSELTKLEIGKMTMTKGANGEFDAVGGLHEYMSEVMASGKGQDIMDMFEMFICKSYGVKSADGRRHTKSPELLAEFQSTAAYDALFNELVTDAAAGAAFFNGIMPKDLQEAVQMQTEAAQQVRGVTPNLVVVDEITDTSGVMPEDVASTFAKPKKGARSKAEIISDFKVKNAIKKGTIGYADVAGLSEDELQRALDGGAVLED